MTDTTIKGKFDEVAGKLKQSVGESVNNERLANEGAAQQVKGHAEQAWGSIKDAAKDIHEQNKDESTGTGHDIREKIASTAQNVKEAITAKAEEIRERHANKA